MSSMVPERGHANTARLDSELEPTRWVGGDMFPRHNAASRGERRSCNYRFGSGRRGGDRSRGRVARSRMIRAARVLKIRNTRA